MKNLLIYAVMLFMAAGATVSCKSEKQYRPSAIGAPYELVLVCDNLKWEGELGDTLRSVLTRPVEMINTYEPIVDVYRLMSLTDLHKKNRNIMFVATGEEYPLPTLTAQYDVYASPQIIINLTGPDVASLTEYVSEYREFLVDIIEGTERDRDVEYNARYGDKMLSKQIFEKMGVNVDLPKGYKVRSTHPDFMWLSFEYPTASQGVLIYSYPYTDRDNFLPDSLLKYRNKFAALVPGENPGSYMTSFVLGDFRPEVRYLRLDNGRSWSEMRGFWDVEGDFMGGPFVSYSTLDTETRRVVAFDFYVYSPDKPKRNYLRQLEHLIYSVGFPSDGQVAGGE